MWFGKKETEDDGFGNDEVYPAELIKQQIKDQQPKKEGKKSWKQRLLSIKKGGEQKQ